MDISRIRKLTIVGTNLGAVATVTGTQQSLQLLSQPRLPTDTSPNPNAWLALAPNQIVSWVDSEITVLSTQDSAFLQVGMGWDVAAAHGICCR